MASDDLLINHSIIIAFDVFAIILIVLLSLVIITVLVSRQVQREAGWFNFMVPATLYPVAFLFQLGNIKHAQPRYPKLCLTQTILIYALPV